MIFPLLLIILLPCTYKYVTGGYTYSSNTFKPKVVRWSIPIQAEIVEPIEDRFCGKGMDEYIAEILEKRQDIDWVLITLDVKETAGIQTCHRVKGFLSNLNEVE